MAYRLNVVPVGADDEGCIVVPAVLRAQSGRTIVLATRLQRSAIVVSVTSSSALTFELS
jgi:hypothetical protein